MEYAEALLLAERARAFLAPACDRVEIAGSIRRKKQTDIKDLEIVAIPSPLEEFGAENALDKLVWDSLLNGGPVSFGEPSKDGKKSPTGPRYYRLKFNGVKLDLFSVLKPAQWGAVFAIRTGDKDFSHWLVQQGYRHGIHEIKGHLALVTDNYGKGPIVTTPFDHDKVPIPYFVVDLHTPEEKDVFAALGVPWMEPEDRVGPHITTAKEWEAATA